MRQEPLTRRTFLAGRAAGAAALGIALAGYGSADATETVDSSAAAEAANSSAAVEAGATELEHLETSGHLTCSLNLDRGSLSPWGVDAETAACINLPVLEGLYEIDRKTNKPYPALAAGDPEEVTTNVYEIELREFPLFSDGSEVTANDVVASFERTRKSKCGAFGELLSLIAEMEATSDERLTVVTKAPLGERLLSLLALVKVVPAKTTAKHLAEGAMGTGPWRLDSINNMRAIMVPNSFYTGTRPATADTLTCYFSTDAAARVNALTYGAVQAIEDAPTNNAVLKKKRSGIEVESVPGFNPALLVFDTRVQPFDDVRVRQAVLWAVDAEALAKDPFDGAAHPATCILDTGNPDYREAAIVYGGDADKAQRLLEDAGVDGLSFAIETGEEPWMEPTALRIAEDLGRAGMSVEVRTMQSRALFEDREDASDDEQIPSVTLTTAYPGVFGDDAAILIRWLFSNNVWMKERTGWIESDAYDQLDELLTTAETIGDDDDDARAEAWGAVFDLIAEQVPLYPILHLDKTTAWRPAEIEGFIPIGTPGLDPLDASAHE